MIDSDCPSSPHLAAFGHCRCQCTFLDVGANDGDTLLTWMGAFLKQGTSYQEKLPSHVSSTLRGCFASQGNLCFYGIEGNPRFTSQLNDVQRLLKEEGFHAKLYTETVFGLEDGSTTMFVDPGNRGMDSSLLATKSTHYFASIDEDQGRHFHWAVGQLGKAHLGDVQAHQRGLARRSALPVVADEVLRLCRHED